MLFVPAELSDRFHPGFAENKVAYDAEEKREKGGCLWQRKAIVVIACSWARVKHTVSKVVMMVHVPSLNMYKDKTHDGMNISLTGAQEYQWRTSSMDPMMRLRRRTQNRDLVLCDLCVTGILYADGRNPSNSCLHRALIPAVCQVAGAQRSASGRHRSGKCFHVKVSSLLVRGCLQQLLDIVVSVLTSGVAMIRIYRLTSSCCGQRGSGSGFL